MKGQVVRDWKGVEVMVAPTPYPQALSLSQVPCYRVSMWNVTWFLQEALRVDMNVVLI